MIKNTGDFIIEILDNLPNNEMLFKMARCKWRGNPEMYEEGVKFWKNIFNNKRLMNKHNFDVIVIIAQESIPNGDCIGHVIFYQNTNDSTQWLISDLKTTGAFRNKGIASMMINTGLDKIKNFGGEKVYVFIENENLPSINLHRKLRFEKVEYEQFDEFTVRENESCHKLDIKKIN